MVLCEFVGVFLVLLALLGFALFAWRKTFYFNCICAGFVSAWAIWIANDYDHHGGDERMYQLQVGQKVDTLLRQSHMKAIIFDREEAGGMRFVEDYPTRRLRVGTHDALIKVHSAVMHPDSHRQRPDLTQPFRRWLLSSPKDYVAVPADFSGKVYMAGFGCNGFLNGGERVFGTAVSGGFIAEYVVVKCETLGNLKDEVEYPESAAAVSAWLAALQLFIRHKISRGSRLLVLGADTPMGNGLLQVAQVTDVEVRRPL